MHQKERWMAGLAIAAIAGCMLAYWAGVAVPGERAKRDNIRVIAPADKAILESGKIDIICSADSVDLQIDGTAHAWEPFELPLHVARTKLKPGLHQIRIGARRLEIIVAKDTKRRDGPKGWKIVHRHAIDDGPSGCQDCHETKQRNGRTQVGEFKGHEACLVCHTAVDFEVDHSHILEPLEACQMCHSLHGSPHKSLLKAPTRRLCSECHDADH